MTDTTTPSPAPATPDAPGIPPHRHFSLVGKLAGILVVALGSYSALTFLGPTGLTRLDRWLGLDGALEVPAWLIHVLALALVLPVTIWTVGRFVRPLTITLAALSDGIRSFRDRDFSVRIANTRTDELGELVGLYNRVGELLQEERGQLRQRELLLQTALDQSPIAIVLVNPLDRIIYANHEARRLFLGGGRLAGLRFGDVVEHCPEEMRVMLAARADGIFSVETEDEPETYHVAQRRFFLNRQPYTLGLVRRMTAELSRQEAEIWKKVIRIISHELNNSMAPVSSLAHSGLLIAREGDRLERLEPIYASIRERVDYLTRFLEGYARFAKLPRPKRQEVTWPEFLDAPRKLYAFETEGDLPAAPGYFDPSQLQQVLINLLKNAVEASDRKPEISVRVDAMPAGGVRVQVLDRGRGMNDEVMRKALLPFYSTKQSGTGVGLPLCREIVEAHGGSMRIQSRDGGGTTVSFWLPAADA